MAELWMAAHLPNGTKRQSELIGQADPLLCGSIAVWVKLHRLAPVQPNRSPTASSSSTATCRYPLVIATFA
jgi:hypothetical protein